MELNCRIYGTGLSLGHHAFFAIGAYVTGMIWIHKLTGTGYYFDPVTMFLSGLGSAIFGSGHRYSASLKTSGRLLCSRNPGARRNPQRPLYQGWKFHRWSGGTHAPLEDIHIYDALLFYQSVFGFISDGNNVFHGQITDRSRSEGN